MFSASMCPWLDNCGDEWDAVPGMEALTWVRTVALPPLCPSPWREETNSGRIRQTEGKIIDKALSTLSLDSFLQPLSSFSLAVSLCLSGHLLSLLYYRVRRPGSKSSSRQTDISVSASHQGNKHFGSSSCDSGAHGLLNSG